MAFGGCHINIHYKGLRRNGGCLRNRNEWKRKSLVFRKLGEDMIKGNEEFNRKCGEILQIELNIEQGLEHFISAYCGYCGSYEEILNGNPVVFPTSATKENIYRIQRLIQPRLSLQQKIDIFIEICKAEGVQGEEHNAILRKIERIQRIRNQVAHGERYFAGSPNLKLRNKRRKFLSYQDDLSKFFQEDELSMDLTDELIKELEQNQNEVFGYIYSVLNRLLKQRMSK